MEEASNENTNLLEEKKDKAKPTTTQPRCPSKLAIAILIMFCIIEFTVYFADETSVPLESAFKSVL